MSNTPLRCRITKGKLIIEIGLDTLKDAVECCPIFYDDKSRKEPPYINVLDSTQLAKDIARSLTSEEEDGSSPLTNLLDDAIADAFYDGSIAFGP